MTVNVRYLDGLKFEAESRGHRVVCDQPFDNGATDGGMTPPEFLAASLGTCAGFYAAQYLRTRQAPAHGLAVRITAEKETRPARLGRFNIEIDLPELDERHHEGILRAVRACLIHNTLVHPPQIDIHLNAHATV
jgi:putative redox protein